MIRFIVEHGSVASVAHAPDPLSTVHDWIEKFICSPHEELGRKGHVCPYVAGSIAAGRLLYAISEADALPLETAERDAVSARELFRVLLPGGHVCEVHDCLVLLLPYLSEAKGCRLLKSVHYAVKPAFVSSGLMLGEFHREMRNRGIHNPAFLSARSPVPLLVVRRMVPADLRFLTEDDEPVARRIEYVTQYLHFLEARLSEQELASATSALEQLEDSAQEAVAVK
jgi:hypothetical protein